MSTTRREFLRPTGLLPDISGQNENAAGVSGTAPAASAELFDVADFERAAQAQMSSMAWEYVAGGAADEITLRWNQEAYRRLRLRPRALVDVSQLDTTVRLFGRELPHPILFAPAAYQKLFHPEGELAVVQGANATDTTFTVSTSATTSIEDIAAAAKKPLWFQLYVQRDRELTRELVRRAAAAGYEALVVTVDTPVLGPRYRELRAKFALPPGMERVNLRGSKGVTGAHRPTEKEIYSVTLDPTLTWKDIEWLRGITRLPVLLKGIMTADDAERAVQAGVAGIIVSNHGARNLDTLPATLDTLPEVAAKISGRLPVLFDGGIRRGTDILKALALGANAVMIGRPYLFGLGAQGATGVARVVNVLRRELESAMALTGRRTLADLDASVIWR